MFLKPTPAAEGAAGHGEAADKGKDKKKDEKGGHGGGEEGVESPAVIRAGPDGVVDRFEVDSFRRDCLLRGVDVIDLTLGHGPEIAAFEAKQKAISPWLYRL